jgi:hypothetical protein
MRVRPESLPIFVDEAPIYAPHGETIKIEFRGLAIFVPIHICMVSMERCQKALNEWKASNCEPISINRRTRKRRKDD